MNYFCTLFDSFYLSRGLVMYDSLARHMDDFHLFIFAFDDRAYDILRDLKLEKTSVISLSEFENGDLLAVKNSRTRAEYCWTCTSSAIDYVLKKYNEPSCTYIDADLYFYSSPEILLDELRAGKNTLITEHRYSRLARIFEEKRAGRFCVQFITFTNNPDSRKILDKWKNQCIDWCYARYEEGRFGDQKYLDPWPEQYPNVHILENHGGGVAPWNARQYQFTRKGDKICGAGAGQSEFEVVFFHFHFVRLFEEGYADLGWNRLDKKVRHLFYLPYINALIEKENFLEKRIGGYKRAFMARGPNGIKDRIKTLFKDITNFNIVKL